MPEEESPWARHARQLRASPAFEALAAGRRDATGLPTPAAAWVAAELGREERRPVLAVVGREADAFAWAEAATLWNSPAAYFASPALTPYQGTEASLGVRVAEVVVIDRILSGELQTVVTTPRGLFRRLPTPDDFAAAVRTVRPGEEVELESLTEHLARHGYQRVDLVGEVGEFAVRGGVLDVFAPGEVAPWRLDFFGDELESIRRFDAADQRSTEEEGEARLLPLTLWPVGREEAQRVAGEVVAELGPPVGLQAREELAALRDGRGFPGWQALQVLGRETSGLAELLSDPRVAVLEPDLLEREAASHTEVLQTDWQARSEALHLAPAPERLERGLAEVECILAGAALRVLSVAAADGASEAVDFAGQQTGIFQGQLPRFPREVETARARGETLVLVTPDERAEELRRWLEERRLEGPGVEVVHGDLERGFRLPGAGVVVFSLRQLFPPAATRPARRKATAAFLSGLRDLRPGDYVVHRDHGIGQYVGLRTVGAESSAPRPELPAILAEMESGTQGREVMELAYGGGRSLLLPLERADLIDRYSGVEGVPPRLDKLGGASWNRRKSRVKSGLRELAGDLLKLYAERRLARAPVLAPPGEMQGGFDAAFEHQETPDQLEAIAAIQEDLGRERPMDRLLCGDVGFGKTEVAMRAAFRAVAAGRQVALLAPTTILADQHLETFRRRFADVPVTIDLLSRFRTATEAKDVVRRARSGELDIVIGTHRLLGKDVGFAKLGLLIVDEEQRFGVAQKERLRELKKSVHVLAMSATPVPRTLQLSLAGVRDLSVIETPPRDRMAVETAVLPFSREAVREAVEFELERGGQVYYVYNEVESIEAMAKELREILGDVRVVVGHGQLPERELSKRMRAFKSAEYDVLLATTIIENGIDIPRVNTMIVHRADRFGLAQLYQLRGRVGRSHWLAYCYLLVPGDRVLSETARQRLQAIREFTELGAGFRIAARDLEIRGAGNLLGPEQSGHIASVGIETYLRMLDETVREMSGEAVPERPSAVIDLPVQAAIPPEYVPSETLRMDLYRRIGTDSGSLSDLAEELEDRFGAPPPEVRALLALAELKRRAEELGVQSISYRRSELQMALRKDAAIDVDRLVRWVGERPGSSFTPTGVLKIPGVAPSAVDQVARRTLDELVGS